MAKQQHTPSEIQPGKYDLPLKKSKSSKYIDKKKKEEIVGVSLQEKSSWMEKAE